MSKSMNLLFAKLIPVIGRSTKKIHLFGINYITCEQHFLQGQAKHPQTKITLGGGIIELILLASS